jgi:hypothetical protein
MVLGTALGNIWRVADRHGGPDRVIGNGHRHVDVFENLSGGDSPCAVGGLNQIVADISLVFTTQRVDEKKRFRKLPGSNQESGAVNMPIGREMVHGALSYPRGRGRIVIKSLPVARLQQARKPA